MLHVARITLVLLLCISLGGYVLYAVINGIRSGIFKAGARAFIRKKSPAAFWCVITFNLCVVAGIGWAMVYALEG